MSPIKSLSIWAAALILTLCLSPHNGFSEESAVFRTKVHLTTPVDVSDMGRFQSSENLAESMEQLRSLWVTTLQHGEVQWWQNWSQELNSAIEEALSQGNTIQMNSSAFSQLIDTLQSQQHFGGKVTLQNKRLGKQSLFESKQSVTQLSRESLSNQQAPNIQGILQPDFFTQMWRQPALEKAEAILDKIPDDQSIRFDNPLNESVMLVLRVIHDGILDKIVPFGVNWYGEQPEQFTQLDAQGKLVSPWVGSLKALTQGQSHEAVLELSEFAGLLTDVPCRDVARFALAQDQVVKRTMEKLMDGEKRIVALEAYNALLPLLVLTSDIARGCLIQTPTEAFKINIASDDELGGTRTLLEAASELPNFSLRNFMWVMDLRVGRLRQASPLVENPLDFLNSAILEGGPGVGACSLLEQVFSGPGQDFACPQGCSGPDFTGTGTGEAMSGTSGGLDSDSGESWASSCRSDETGTSAEAALGSMGGCFGPPLGSSRNVLPMDREGTQIFQCVMASQGGGVGIQISSAPSFGKGLCKTNLAGYEGQDTEPDDNLTEAEREEIRERKQQVADAAANYRPSRREITQVQRASRREGVNLTRDQARDRLIRANQGHAQSAGSQWDVGLTGNPVSNYRRTVVEATINYSISNPPGSPLESMVGWGGGPSPISPEMARRRRAQQDLVPWEGEGSGGGGFTCDPSSSACGSQCSYLPESMQRMTRCLAGGQPQAFDRCQTARDLCAGPGTNPSSFASQCGVSLDIVDNGCATVTCPDSMGSGFQLMGMAFSSGNTEQMAACCSGGSNTPGEIPAGIPNIQDQFCLANPDRCGPGRDGREFMIRAQDVFRDTELPDNDGFDGQ